MNIGEKIKTLRIAAKITQEELANAVNTTKQTIHKYETGIISNIPASKIKSIADKLNTTPAWLMGWNKAEPLVPKDYITIPVLGYVAAGVPIEAIEDIIDYEEVSANELNPNYEYFGLKIKGDSMSPRIQNGDVVIVRQQPDVDSGDVAIVCVNGDSATCKKIKKEADGILLIPFNPAYETKFYSNEKIETLPITILGKVVELRGKF